MIDSIIVARNKNVFMINAKSIFYLRIDILAMFPAHKRDMDNISKLKNNESGIYMTFDVDIRTPLES